MRLIDADALNWEEPTGIDDCEDTFTDGFNWLKDQIKRVPTVHWSPEGKWLEKEVEDRPIIEQWQTARCSACGKYHTTPYMYYFDEYAFCPHCGADMREGEENG